MRYLIILLFSYVALRSIDRMDEPPLLKHLLSAVTCSLSALWLVLIRYG